MAASGAGLGRAADLVPTDTDVSYSKALIAAVVALGVTFASAFGAVVLLGGSGSFHDWPSPPRGGESKSRTPQQLRRVSPSELATLARVRPSGGGPSGARSNLAAASGGKQLVPPGGPGLGQQLAGEPSPVAAPPSGAPPANPPAVAPTPRPAPPTTPVAIVQPPATLPGPIGGATPAPRTGPGVGPSPQRSLPSAQPSLPSAQTKSPASRPSPPKKPKPVPPKSKRPSPGFPPGFPAPPGLLPPVFPSAPEAPGHKHHHKRHHHRHHGRGRDNGKAERRRHGHHGASDHAPQGRAVGRHPGPVPRRHLGWVRGRQLGWTVGPRVAAGHAVPSPGHLRWLGQLIGRHRHHGWGRRR